MTEVDSNTDTTTSDNEGDTGNNSHRRRLIRKRPVSFGISRNYHGTVYTIPGDENSDGEEEDDGSVTLEEEFDALRLSPSAEAVHRRIVAMIGVPPHHVPEGILNLMHAHRPYVEHVRVMIADSEEDNDEDEEDSRAEKNGESTNHLEGDEKEEEFESDNNHHFGLDFAEDHEKQRRDRTYLILVQLFREEDAETFVEELDGKPYIAFDDRDTCHIERVARVETTKAMPGMDSQDTLPALQSKSNERSSTTRHVKSLPLLHPNFGSDLLAAGKGPSLEKKTGEPKSGRFVGGRTNYEDSTINCAVCLEDLGLEEKKIDDGNAVFDVLRGGMPTVCRPVPTPQSPPPQQPSLLTTVCNHTFHLDCLQRCTGPCPVCRYDHSGLNETLSQCHVCGTTEHNYVCLICGVVSCGVPRTAAASSVAAAASSSGSDSAPPSPRFYTSSHAGQHYKDTLHAYALDTETQHVYDFCGQGYVHRLVQNKDDGKLVEVNNPRPFAAGVSGERTLTPGLSDAQEGEVVHRKLEGAAEQYNNLLKSQLERQRAYYEERLLEVKREFSVEHQKARAADLLTVLKQEKKQVAHRLSTLQRRKAKVDETVSFLTNMNESLESNKLALKHRIQQAARERNDSKDMIRKYMPELEAKVSKLMAQLTE